MDFKKQRDEIINKYLKGEISVSETRKAMDKLEGQRLSAFYDKK